MDIAAYCDWTRDGLNVGLFHEDCTDTFAEFLHFGFLEVLASLELLYPFVGVVYRHDRGGK